MTSGAPPPGPPFGPGEPEGHGTDLQVLGFGPVVTQRLEPGNWFFHEGQWALCAEAWKDDNEWKLNIHFEKWNKPLLEKTLTFKSLSDAKKFLSEYFEDDVVDVEPDRLPSPDAL